MHSQPFARSRIAATGAALVLLLIAAGCASDDDQPRPPHGSATAKPRHFSTLAGQETFFNGAITADVLVGAMTGFESNGGGGSGGPGGGHHHGGMHGGGGGGGHRHSDEGQGGGTGGPPPGDGENGEAEGNSGGAIRHAEAMGSPPVMIHLRFTNHGGTHADLEIADFLSALGNFVVQPEKLGLDPGQAVEVEPMTSRLAGEIISGEITLELRLGGAKETKTIALALKPEPATPPTPTPPTASEPAK